MFFAIIRQLATSMDTLTALHTRASSPRLTYPPPPADVLQNVYRSALRAADHARLRPWRYLTIQGNGLKKLGQLFVDAAIADNGELSDEDKHKISNKALRAPLVIVAIAKVCEHPKVPRVEQLMSTAAGVQNMALAIHAQGYGSVWRTGAMASHSVVRDGFELGTEDEIVGFLYVGTIDRQNRLDTSLQVDDYFEVWG